MKKTSLVVAVMSLTCIASQVYANQKQPIATGTSHPASKEWVLEQIASLNTQLTTPDWNAVCTSGSPASSSGCFGNVSSSAFTKINNGIGGFTTVANINTTNAPAGSVFIKAFYAGTNTPVGSTYISVTLASGNIARCGIYLQQGTGLDTLYGGSINTTISNGDTAGPVAAHPVVINSSTVAIGLYSGSNTPAPPQLPLYLVCAGVNSNGASAASLSGAGVITAV
jgi:hypothetical protein